MPEVPIAGPADRPSAELAVAILNEKGIRARLAPGLIETTWTIGAPTRVNPVRILVLEEDAARAEALLGATPSASARPPRAPSRFAISALVAMLAVALLLFGWVLARSLVVP